MISSLRLIAVIALVVLLSISLLAAWVAPYSYDQQFREEIWSDPGERFLLGTDSLGRDRLSRLIYGTQISMLMAPAAALISILLATVIGASAGFLGGPIERGVSAVIDLFLSLPWLFLLLIVRALLPLNTSPSVSVAITFALLACLGWAAPARVVCTAARSFRGGDLMLQAGIMGLRPSRIFLTQLLPNLKPLLVAQFWIGVPLFILGEANLGVLGLGVSEPVPSWGNLLGELQDFPAVAEQPAMLAPVGVLIATLLAARTVAPIAEEI